MMKLRKMIIITKNYYFKQSKRKIIKSIRQALTILQIIIPRKIKIYFQVKHLEVIAYITKKRATTR